MRTALLVLLTFLLWPAVGAAQTPEATPGATPIVPAPSCDDLPDYQEAMAAVYADLPDEDRELLATVDIEAVETLRPSQLRAVSDALDTLAGGFEDIPDDQIPAIARDYHQAVIDGISVMSSMFLTMATDGLLGALAYTDALDETTQALEQAEDQGRIACPDRWVEFIDEGVFNDVP